MKKRISKWDISCFGWNNITGVYCVCSIQDNKTKVHYIGSSKDIGKRLANNKHPYRVLYNNGVKAFIKYKETKNYLELEKDLIKKLKPELNYIFNRGGLHE